MIISVIIPIEDSSILQNIFDLLVQVEQTQVEDCGSLEFELSLKDSMKLFYTLPGSNILGYGLRTTKQSFVCPRIVSVRRNFPRRVDLFSSYCFETVISMRFIT